MKERQREGIADARAAGRYKGRKPTARAKAADAVRLFREGHKVSQVAKTLGIGAQASIGLWQTLVSTVSSSGCRSASLPQIGVRHQGRLVHDRAITGAAIV
jgi:DNA invertase Pin-like site-specific DNA recombinase